MRDVFALTTRGLERLGAGEMAALSGVTVDQVAYRRVAARAEALPPLLDLRTVDDVFLAVAAWQGIGRQRSALTRLRELSGQLELRTALAQCAEVRAVPPAPAFSITVNFVGRRNYSTAEIRQACAEGIATRHGWTYVAEDVEADLNVRLFIEHDVAHVGMRLGRHPLHRRPYKQVHVPGSLKPTVAAAMLALAGVQPGMRVLDPCCGAGTIPIEATLAGAAAWGGDVDPAAVAAARSNAAAAGVTISLDRWDARALPLPDVSIDRVVCNPPWGREVRVDAALEALYRAICAETRRVLAPGGQVAMLTSLPHLVRFDDLRRHAQVEISLFGQTPTIVCFS